MKNNTLLDFITQEFNTQRYKDFISHIFSNQEGLEFQIEEFKELGSVYHKLKKEYCLLSKALDLQNFQTLQFYIFEVESINAKIGLYKELKDRLRTIGASAILACFYQVGNPTFRLSLITRSLDEQGRIDYSNPKRQSFILGKNINTRTAQKQLSKLQSIPSFDDLKNAFAIEPLSKEFFNAISRFFLEFIESTTFPKSQNQTQKRQFSLRLIARILFCKFLEKKKVIPKEIWDTKLSASYYHDVLEPLFFLTLNTPKEKEIIYYLIKKLSNS